MIAMPAMTTMPVPPVMGSCGMTVTGVTLPIDLAVDWSDSTLRLRPSEMPVAWAVFVTSPRRMSVSLVSEVAVQVMDAPTASVVSGQDTSDRGVLPL